MIGTSGSRRLDFILRLLVGPAIALDHWCWRRKHGHNVKPSTDRRT